jgi:hypothetical protein
MNKQKEILELEKIYGITLEEVKPDKCIGKSRHGMSNSYAADENGHVTHLNLSCNELTEIKGLETLVNLQSLDLCRNELTGIKGLEALVNLLELWLSGNELTEIKGLETLVKLQSLNLFNTRLTEIKGLETLVNLQSLDLSFNQLTGIKGLETLVNLQSLDLSSNQLTDIKGMETLVNLQSLKLYSNHLTEIKGMETLVNLQSLNLCRNYLTEIKGLEPLVNLQSLNLSQNHHLTDIKGLKPLVNLQTLDLFYTSVDLQELNLSVNKQTGIKGLETLEKVQKKKNKDMKTLTAFSDDGKWGYKDRETNSILIPALYEDLCPLNGEAFYTSVAVKLDGKWGLRSVLNEELTPLLYDEVKEGIGYDFIVGNSSKYGVLDQDGERTVPALFDEIDKIDRNSFNYYRVMQGGKRGLVSRSGNIILHPVYDDVHPFDHGYHYAATVTLNNRKGVADNKGNLVIPIEYEDIVLFPEAFNTFGVRTDGKWRLITRLLEPVSGETYDEIKPFQYAQTLGVKQDGKWRTVKFDGKDLFPYRFEEIDHYPGPGYCSGADFYTGKMHGCWGIIDERGKICLPFEYDTVNIEDINPISITREGLRVKDEKLRKKLPSEYGHIHINQSFRFKFTKGDYAGELIYDPVPYVMLKMNNGKCGIMNKSGETLVPFDYDELSFYDDVAIPACKDGKWGYIDINNNTVLPFIYDEIQCFDGDYAVVKLNKEYGIINRQGEFVIPPKYSNIHHTFENGMAEVELVRTRFMIDQSGSRIKAEKQRIFVLTVFYVVVDYNKTVENYEDLMPKYPEYEVRSEQCGFYSSLKNAEAAIHTHIREMKNTDWRWHERNESMERLNDLLYRDTDDNDIVVSEYGKIHSYRIEEMKVDIDGNDRHGRETLRSYLPDGTFWAENLTSETEDCCTIDEKYDRETMQRMGAFVGRNPEEILFRNGDIVEVLCSTVVKLGIVWRCPTTIKERKQYKMSWTDHSDDIYLVLGNHDVIYNFKKGDKPYYIDDINSYPAIVFKPKFPVPEELAESLRLGYEYWISDESVEVEKQYMESHKDDNVIFL